MGRAGRKASLAALHLAYELGINFVDTARSYGYGDSEGLIGEFLAGRRDSVVICTKFGILPSNKGGWKRKLKPIAQAAVNIMPGLRGVARRQAAGQLVHRKLTPALLRSSLEESLRELKTDYVDMLLMHDVDSDALNNTDLLEALERLVSAGTVRVAGVSGVHRVIEGLLKQRPQVIRTVQCALDPSSLNVLYRIRSARAQNLFVVANHPFGGTAGVHALSELLIAMRDDVTLSSALRDKLHGDIQEILPEIVFGCILQGTGVSGVVSAMIQPRNLRQNIRAVDQCRFSSDELQVLRRIIARRSQTGTRGDGHPASGSTPSK